jgi:hypothetical protein
VVKSGAGAWPTSAWGDKIASPSANAQPPFRMPGIVAQAANLRGVEILWKNRAFVVDELSA